MEQFFQDIYMSVLHKWVKNVGVNLEPYIKEEGIYFQNENAQGIIHFWPNCIIEEEIFDSQKHERIFYLHFQVHHLHRAKILIQEFFDFLNQYQNKKKKILLCCSGGITTSYFAYEMSELAEKLSMPYQIDATGYTNIDNIIDDYQYILLAPQVAYLEATLKKQYRSHVIMNIKPKIFATHQYIDALKQIDEEVKNYEKDITRL